MRRNSRFRAGLDEALAHSQPGDEWILRVDRGFAEGYVVVVQHAASDEQVVTSRLAPWRAVLVHEWVAARIVARHGTIVDDTPLWALATVAVALASALLVAGAALVAGWLPQPIASIPWLVTTLDVLGGCAAWLLVRRLGRVLEQHRRPIRPRTPGARLPLVTGQATEAEPGGEREFRVYVAVLIAGTAASIALFAAHWLTDRGGLLIVAYASMACNAGMATPLDYPRRSIAKVVGTTLLLAVVLFTQLLSSDIDRPSGGAWGVVILSVSVLPTVVALAPLRDREHTLRQARGWRGLSIAYGIALGLNFVGIGVSVCLGAPLAVFR